MASGILFARRIKGEMAIQGKMIDDMLVKIGRSSSWWQKSMNRPQGMRIEDFIKICRELHLDPAEVMKNNILYGGK